MPFFSDGLPQQWVKDISDDYGGVLPEFLRSINSSILKSDDILAYRGFERLYCYGGIS